jgi:DNA polymerase-3 subunit delta
MSRIGGSRRLDEYDPTIRCYLFYGPDEAGSRALATAIAKAFGTDAERIELSPDKLRNDPALLADEAASISLFGTLRYVSVEGAGDECFAAVDNLLSNPSASNPVLLVAGALRKDARIVKRLDGDRHARVVASYLPDAADLARLAVTRAAELGLRIDTDLGARIVAHCAGDRTVMQREIEKLAAFADASPESPSAANDAMLEAVSADRAEADLSAVVDATMRGDQRALEVVLSQLGGEGQDSIALLRAFQRRLIAMAAVRIEVDRGMPAKAAAEKAARTIFWRDRETIVRDIGHWPAQHITAAIERLLTVERELKSSRGPGAVSLDRLLHTIARSVRR